MNKTPEIVIVAALARNGVIGRDNGLPWRLKADLQHFRALTMGHPILMGRNTWESLGRPLPGRRNLVVTRDTTFKADGAEVFTDPEAAIAAAADAERLFVIGGAQLYKTLFPRAERLVLTEVWADVEGDAHFPMFDRSDFVEERRDVRTADADNEYDYDFVEYRRR
ncbi:MAG TPA: dihydrofolate reductase [Thauera sp.]|uniref:dihydrofolate reductase n=1 Tax=Thauera sp. TaxID=1905334 RepID=UPI002B78C241|nr:dihydrofolate reductase [Thauera sp.]HRP24686.1 dihydrofolate reductase [Thauera sp.]HRP66301.1 dihydrofolate reductase [Thauera sp.]